MDMVEKQCIQALFTAKDYICLLYTSYHNCVTSKFQFMLVRIQRNNVGSVLNHQKPTFILIPFYHNTDISSTLPSLFICFRAEPLPAGDGINKTRLPSAMEGQPGVLLFPVF